MATGNDFESARVGPIHGNTCTFSSIWRRYGSEPWVKFASLLHCLLALKSLCTAKYFTFLHKTRQLFADIFSCNRTSKFNIVCIRTCHLALILCQFNPVNILAVHFKEIYLISSFYLHLISSKWQHFTWFPTEKENCICFSVPCWTVSPTYSKFLDLTALNHPGRVLVIYFLIAHLIHPF